MSLGLILNIEILFFKKYYLIINKEKGIQKSHRIQPVAFTCSINFSDRR